MAKEVFNRYELKFRINDKQYKELRERLSEHMEADAYSKDGDFYTICNIYYDTPANDLIRRSLEGPVYKEKMRLRSYGTVGTDTKVFLEIKKKYEGLVNKRRTKIILSDAYDYFETGKKPEVRKFMNGQVLNEIDYMKTRLGLVPKVFLSYDRCALFAKDDHEFRVTFDRNITARRYDLGLHYGIYGDKLIGNDEWIMEVKIDRAMPLWMTNILSDMKIYKNKFSKYGEEYRLFVEAQTAARRSGATEKIYGKETEKCSNHYSELQTIVQ
ncbi:MAG: polyphosphate polymerase domain-containing protein [Lachnospiraceae bacterium]|nr:polyphosphate polymerase domain-containing protein [Lachnospiraceae bacterium]